MAFLLFLAAAATEIASAILIMIKGSPWRKTRDVIRIAQAGIFIPLIMLGVIVFSASWVAFSVLLFALAAVGTVNLFRKGKNKVISKPRRVAVKALGMTVLIFLAALPAILFPGYRMLEPAGPFDVKTAVYTYTDTERIETFTDLGEHRSVNVGMWYPDGNGKYPLIVFSHGGLSVMTSNESLYNELASQGYVVCSIGHPYHSMSTTDPNGKTVWVDSGYMRELNTEDAKTDREQSLGYYRKWMKIRTEDISFVIDRILFETKKEHAELVYGRIDASKIGVMGHSLGGSAALGVGRKRDDIGAVIALESPFMCDIIGVRDGEFVFTDEIYPVPVLNVYSDSAFSHLGEWPQYKQNYKLLSEGRGKAFNVYIQGTGHLTLTDFALTSPILSDLLNGFGSTADTEYCLRTVKNICLEFFDAYLKGAGEFTSERTY